MNRARRDQALAESILANGGVCKHVIVQRLKDGRLVSEVKELQRQPNELLVDLRVRPAELAA